MNLLDLGILVLLFLVTLRGYFRGLFQELAVLVGLVGGLVVAARVYLDLAALLLPLINSLFWAQVLAFALVLVAVYWGVRLLAYVLQNLLYHLYLDVFDRLLGAFFALLKGALILGMVLLLVGVVVPQNNHLLQGSRTKPILTRLARRTLDLLPPNFKKRLKEYLEKVPIPKEKRQAEGAGTPFYLGSLELKSSNANYSGNSLNIFVPMPQAAIHKPGVTQKYENFKLPPYPNPLPPQAAGGGGKEFLQEFFGTAETAATGRPITITIFLIATREPAALSKA
jgi:membrane protein required for colicin V production